MLNFENVSFSYQGSETVRDVSFHIDAGSWTALVGENGAGKSTVARLCNGLLRPAQGRVTACGRDTAAAKTSSLARDIGFLFQNPDRQICHTTVRDEIGFALDNAVPDAEERTRRIEALLQAFALKADSVPFKLSRGERQKVAVASVLARQPKLLILDEPTTGLDGKDIQMVMNAVAELNKAGTAILMVTHDMELVENYAGQTLRMAEGRML
jgi:energy-coupling factor transport system ATP-binding protein